MSSSSARLRAAVPVAAVLLAAPLGGCSDSKPTGPGATPPAAPVAIVVTNDDGVAATGLDVIATRLRALPGVTVAVVAPAKNQSGSDGKTTPGALSHNATTTKSGLPATAVDGYPADTIRVAVDDLQLKPQLVVSGINAGPNVGPVAGISGTVGAARAATARGIPALAVSQGFPVGKGQYDYPVGADFAIAQVQQLIDRVRTGTADPTAVSNLNVPTCAAGRVRGLRELPAENRADPRAILPSNCTSTENPDEEIEAFHDGFAVLTRLPK
jgi:5'-nucleotidase